VVSVLVVNLQTCGVIGKMSLMSRNFLASQMWLMNWGEVMRVIIFGV